MVQDSFSKIKGKQKLKRKTNQRKSYDRILIVCEGTKTEPAYFKQIKQEQRLASTNLKVLPGRGTSPLQVVEHAEKLFKEGFLGQNIPMGNFDRVYAVFDRDSHSKYIKALDKIETLNNKLKNDNKIKVPFIAIPSNPCFELWLLLHFEDVTALFDCKMANTKLKSHFSSYKKSSNDVFERTKSNLDKACKRAAKLNKKSNKHSRGEPFTYINELVNLLRNLKN